MAEAILWATLIIASASLIFAFIAFRQVMKTSSSVDEFIERADSFLDHFKKSAKGVFTPKFMGDAINHALLDGLTHDDGSQVTMSEYVAGWVNAKGPGIYADLKKEIPNYIPIIMNSSPDPSPNSRGPPNKGTQLANARWQGSGGLDAAKNLAKAAKKVPMAAKVADVIDTGQALIGLVQPAKELIGELKGLKGGGGNGDKGEPSSTTEGVIVDWQPPLGGS